MAGFFEGHGMETGILKRSRSGRVDHGVIHRTDRQQVAYTSPQLALQIKGCKCTAGFGEVRRWRIKGDQTVFKSGENRLVCQLKQQGSFFRRELASLHVNRTRSKQRHLGRPAEE